MLVVPIEMLLQYAFTFSFPINVNLYEDNRTTEPYISAKQIIMEELRKTALHHAARVPEMGLCHR